MNTVHYICIPTFPTFPTHFLGSREHSFEDRVGGLIGHSQQRLVEKMDVTAGRRIARMTDKNADNILRIAEFGGDAGKAMSQRVGPDLARQARPFREAFDGLLKACERPVAALGRGKHVFASLDRLYFVQHIKRALA